MPHTIKKQDCTFFETLHSVFDKDVGILGLTWVQKAIKQKFNSFRNSLLNILFEKQLRETTLISVIKISSRNGMDSWKYKI